MRDRTCVCIFLTRTLSAVRWVELVRVMVRAKNRGRSSSKKLHLFVSAIQHLRFFLARSQREALSRTDQKFLRS